MSMKYFLRCNVKGCRKRSREAYTEGLSRVLATMDGWKTFNAIHDGHMCPSCSAKREVPK